MRKVMLCRYETTIYRFCFGGALAASEAVAAAAAAARARVTKVTREHPTAASDI